MGRKMKKLTRAGAGALAGVMVFGLAAPLAPLSVEAADEVKNLAIGSTATVNDKETDYWGADKAVDGIVNRTAAKRDQSRWATNVGGDADAKWLKIDLKEAKTFQSFVLAWERRNITGYKIQISQTGEDNSWEDVYTKTGASHISHINENIHLPEAKTARYVRLYIDGYTANAADDHVSVNHAGAQGGQNLVRMAAPYLEGSPDVIIVQLNEILQTFGIVVECLPADVVV